MTTAKQAQFQNDIMLKIATTVLEQIEAGTAPWQKPWATRASLSAANGITGREYKGLNSLYLSILGMESGCQYWCGAKQGMKAGGTPLKGTGVYIMAPMLKTGTNDEGEKFQYVSGFRCTRVHNMLTGFTGLEDKVAALTASQAPQEPRTLDAGRLDAFMAATGAQITYGGSRAYYSPSEDAIHLPEKGDFHTEGGFYGTALHELIHWTGHKSRQDRLSDKSKRGYAFEELIAELGAFYASERLGCPNEAANHASYVGSWLKALSSDPKYVWDAAIKAEKAAELLISTAQEEPLPQAA